MHNYTLYACVYMYSIHALLYTFVNVRHYIRTSPYRLAHFIGILATLGYPESCTPTGLFNWVALVFGAERTHRKGGKGRGRKKGTVKTLEGPTATMSRPWAY